MTRALNMQGSPDGAGSGGSGPPTPPRLSPQASASADPPASPPALAPSTSTVSDELPPYGAPGALRCMHHRYNAELCSISPAGADRPPLPPRLHHAARPAFPPRLHDESPQAGVRVRLALRHRRPLPAAAITLHLRHPVSDPVEPGLRPSVLVSPSSVGWRCRRRQAVHDHCLLCCRRGTVNPGEGRRPTLGVPTEILNVFGSRAERCGEAGGEESVCQELKPLPPRTWGKGAACWLWSVSAKGR
jgi:hypothetical protein